VEITRPKCQSTMEDTRKRIMWGKRTCRSIRDLGVENRETLDRSCWRDYYSRGIRAIERVSSGRTHDSGSIERSSSCCLVDGLFDKSWFTFIIQFTDEDRDLRVGAYDSRGYYFRLNHVSQSRNHRWRQTVVSSARSRPTCCTSVTSAAASKLCL
jgi:hypothetical protein